MNWTEILFILYCMKTGFFFRNEVHATTNYIFLLIILFFILVGNEKLYSRLKRHATPPVNTIHCFLGKLLLLDVTVDVYICRQIK